MFKLRFVAALAVAVSFGSTAAYAQATRTWVSGVGDDANPCSRTAPCKTFAGAISKTAAKGEINVLDPGGFGAVTITKAITIDGGPFTAGIVVSGTNGIIVNTASDPNAVVVLRHLDINGLGTGLSGVNIIKAGDVRVEDSKIFGFNNNGILDARTSGKLTVLDSMIHNNGQFGVYASAAPPSTLAVSLERVRLDRDLVAGFGMNGGGSAVIKNSTASNSAIGFYATDTGTSVTLEDSVAFGNTTSFAAGVYVWGGATFRLSNSTITGNGTGLVASGGSIISYGNNRISGNTTNGAPTSTIGQQ